MSQQEEPDLTDAERHAIRDLLKRDERASWLWATLRVWSLWITAVLAAITIGWDSFKRVAKAAVGL